MDKMDNELFSRINEGILEEKYAAFNRNLQKNSAYIAKSGGLREIISEFNGRDVIVAGAGASLSDDIDILKKHQGRDDLIIISTDMALLPLYCRNILPRFVISCETTPVDYFSHVNTEKMHLLAFSCMSNSNLRKWKGKISFYNWMMHNALYDKLWEKAGSGLGFVATGSIVTTQAVSMVLGCGIRSLMLIGNDMGFMTEYYVNGTVVQKKVLSNTMRFNPSESIEFDKSRRAREYEIHRGDRLYYTNNQFLAAKYWLEDLLKKVNTPVYENSGLGCSPQAVRKISLRKYLERFEKRTVRRRK